MEGKNSMERMKQFIERKNLKEMKESLVMQQES